MDNSRYVGPSKEYQAFHDANPDLKVLQDGHSADGWDDPAKLRLTANKAKADLVKDLYVKDGFDKTVVTTDHTVLTRDGAAIPLRSYRPAAVDPAKPLPAYIYFHGGGMMFGSIETEDYAGAFISSRSGFQVLHVEYRHTPEFTHPTTLNDAWDTFEWVNANATALAVDPANLLVGGVSAGGCLTASVVFQEVALARKEDRPVRIKGQLLVIPWLVHRDVYPYELFASKDKCSIVQCAETSILPSAVYNRFTDIFDVKDPAEPLMNVGLASLEDLEGMPRAAFIVSGWDMLRDEAFILAEKLEKLGVPTKKHIFTGLPHAFRKWAALESSKRYDDLTIESLKWLANLDGKAKVDGKGSWFEEIPEAYR